MTMYPSSVLALLAEMEQATTQIIERHFAADEKQSEPTLAHWAPFRVEVHTEDGKIAEFMEEGVNLL